MSGAKQRRLLGTPPLVALKLDDRALPRQITKEYIKAFISRSARVKQAELAWNSFGKPGRDIQSAKSVFAQLAQEKAWVPGLKAADLSVHWAEIVGESIAKHTHIVSFEQGELTIRATSTAWSTQLNYMIPQLTATVAARLAPVKLEKIIVKGPNAYTFKRGRYSLPGRGPRDTWG